MMSAILIYGNNNMNESVVTCNVCTGDFDLDGEGGITGDLGMLPVSFCPTCLSGMTDLVSQLMEGDEELAQYIANYINEELERKNSIDSDTILYAMDAYNGGAR